ncbi:hypothetical protein AALO_G00061280 [Alosa alosa]|uniref:Uncharacterized protein n=1 Tax=Alosa alosa TaxID=278164 RepID=A0AAV6H094_9TELE|nr:hypothetical protein AALO_G00061280 [Alosa alosa]
MLVREVKACEHTIYGDARTPPKLPELCWLKILLSPEPVELGAVVEGEVQPTTSRSRGATRRPRSRHGSISQGEHPFLDLQQAGFDMLGKELVGRLSTCLSRMEMLLRPLLGIADNLGRLAEAVERVAPAATPPPSPSTRSPPFNRSTWLPAPPGPYRTRLQ